MTLEVEDIYDNAPNPGIAAYAYIPDQLIADAKLAVTQPITLSTGNLVRGAVLGRKTTSSVIPTFGAENHGNGTVSALSVGGTPMYGNFVLTWKSATDVGVVDPEGNVLADATVGDAYTSAEINFTLTAGGTAWQAGDSLVLEAVNDVGEFALCVKTASDGSQVPVAILVMDTNASAGPVRAGAYFSGEFNARAINFDTSWTLQQLMAAVAPPLFLKSSVSAADPTDPPAAGG